LICTKLCWQIPSELQFFSTRNAFITILSSRVILPVKMHKRGYYSTVLFLLKKTGSYSQNIIINAKQILVLAKPGDFTIEL